MSEPASEQSDTAVSVLPRLGMLSWLNIPAGCPMHGGVVDNGAIQINLGSANDQWEIEFQPAALHEFLSLGFDLLCEAANANPEAMTAHSAFRAEMQSSHRAQAVRMLAKLCETFTDADTDSGG